MQVDGSREQNGCGKFNDISVKALKAIKEFGITHVWYTGVIEHAIVEGYPESRIANGNPLVIKGRAGSPYAIRDYYDVNADLATDVNNRINEFKDLLDRTHKLGLKAIIDFVPNHLARQYNSDQKPDGIEDFGTHDDVQSAFSRDNNFYYLPGKSLLLSSAIQNRFPNSVYEEFPARATGNDRFTSSPEISDWYETIKLNYGIDIPGDGKKHFNPIPDTWHKMKQVLFYWARMGVDGFRCDMAEMVPVEFWEWIIPQLKQAYPWIIFIAEVYNPQLYKSYIKQGKFDYLYDKVGLYDTLIGVMKGERPASDISECWQQLQGLDRSMLRFLENHDEQRIASRFVCGEANKAIPAMAVSAFMHQGPLMHYNGQEVGETAEGVAGYSGDDGRTTIFDYWHMPQHQQWMNAGAFDGAQLSTAQKELRGKYQAINQMARQPAISNGLFYDAMWHNADNANFNAGACYAFLRYHDVQQLLIVCNFSSEAQKIKVKIPAHALEIIKVPRPSKLRFTCQKSKVTNSSGTEELINTGLAIEVPAYDYVIFELGW